MSAAALLEKARQTGISLTVVDSKLRLEADDEPPAELVEAIVRQKTEIIALLREDSPKPDPAELEERKALAMDSVPERYRDSWAQFQCQCPAGVTEQAWRQAIDDVGRFLAQWGALADTFGWTPDDLVWWLRGRTVTSLGPEHAAVGDPAYDLAVVEANKIITCGSALLNTLQEIFSGRRDRMSPDLAELAALLSARDVDGERHVST